jgi:ubiquinone/menaquinone biosynthesis C-methylase UbiE
VYVELEAQDHHTHKRFSERLAFTLNNRVRRSLEPPDRLISKLGLRPSDVVVDFGCGPGFYTIPMAKIVARTIALDISARMLERTNSNARKNGVTVDLLTTDGTEIKLADESVDLIFLNHVLHEVVNRQKVLSEFMRILKSSGRLTVVERTRSGIFSGKLGPPIIDQEEVAQDLERAGFSLVQTIAYGNDSIIVGKKP